MLSSAAWNLDAVHTVWRVSIWATLCRHVEGMLSITPTVVSYLSHAELVQIRGLDACGAAGVRLGVCMTIADLSSMLCIRKRWFSLHRLDYTASSLKKRCEFHT